MMNYKFLQHHFIFASKESALLHLKLVLLLQFGGSLLMAVIMFPLVLRGMDTARALAIAGAVTVPAAFGLCWYMLAGEFRDLNRGTWPMHNTQHQITYLNSLLSKLQGDMIPEIDEMIAGYETLLIDTISIYQSALSDGRQNLASEAQGTANKIRNSRIRVMDLRRKAEEAEVFLKSGIASAASREQVESLGSRVGNIRNEINARMSLLIVTRNHLHELQASA